MPPKAAAAHEPVTHGLPARALDDERAKPQGRSEGELRALAAELEVKRRELAVASRSQAEFLANLSHELRSPLNSVLILSRLLTDNLEGNLSEKQLSFARTIYSSGSDLLALINDVVDLSRIQAGALSLEAEELSLQELCDQAAYNFRQLAAERGIALSVELAPGLPKTVFTDGRRLQQVLKNLLHNAFKFTERGRVTLSARPAQDEDPREPAVLFAVTDTGIGVPDAERATIFEPFQQVGGKPVRGQRGAGLGLSLVRELCRVLGGEVRLAHSSVGGSTFTARIPLRLPSASKAPPPSSPRVSVAADPGSIAPANARGAVLMLGSADPEIVRLLTAEAATAGLELIVRARADEGVRLEPVRGVVLDLRPPGLEGWIWLDRMVRDPSTRHVPVFALAGERERARAARLGAFVIEAATQAEIAWAFDQMSWHHPAQQRRLLAFDPLGRLGAVALGADLETRRVSTLEELSSALSLERYHALFVATEGLEAPLQAILDAVPERSRRLPIVIFAPHPPSAQEAELLVRHSEGRMLALGSDVELLGFELSIALHRPSSSLDAPESERLERAGDARLSLSGLKVLIIDDDVRNIFAMTSALERHGVRVLYAETGRQGLELLAQTPDIRAVLVDIRMSEQNGYEVVRAIRDDPRRASLPLIAVTANAMPADREKCLSSGATHYLPKPTTPALLVSTLRVVTARPSVSDADSKG